MTQATLTFPNIEMAKQFGIEWTRFTFEGRTESAVKEDGSADVIVYNVDDARKEWIESWVAPYNA